MDPSLSRYYSQILSFLIGATLFIVVGYQLGKAEPPRSPSGFQTVAATKRERLEYDGVIYDEILILRKAEDPERWRSETWRPRLSPEDGRLKIELHEWNEFERGE